MKKETLKNETLKNIKWIDQKSRVKFHYLAGINRPIYPAQVTKLAKSLNRMGCLRPVVVSEISFITGKPQLYIIDGQHLFNALLRNNTSIPYIVIKTKDKKDLIETIALLNASSKTWSMQDYVTAWSSLIEDYVKLNHYFEVYDIEMSIVAAILTESQPSSGNVTKKLKDGSFRIINEKKNIKILDQLTDVLNVAPRMNRFENRYLCSEYVRFVKNTSKYNHQKFLQNLTKNKKQLLLATQEEGKLVELFNKITCSSCPLK
jgi:hypothetical protein